MRATKNMVYERSTRLLVALGEMMNDEISILILEDDLALLEALREILGELGHRVEMAADSQRAVELSWEQDFDILVTDIRMSGMDGLQALAKILEVLPELKSLVITGFSSEADTIRALRLGVGEYLTKPFDMDTLSAAVQRLVAQVKELRQQQRREDDLRRFLLWAMQQKAESWVTQAAERVAELASRLQIESGGAEAIQLASLCQNLSLGNFPPELPRLLPPASSAILRSPQGMEGQILEVARQLALGQALPEGLSAAVREAAGRDDVSEAIPARRNRTALALAIRLEESGQATAAVSAYQRLLAAGPSREGVVAGLHLARLAGKHGRTAQLQEYALQALEMAARLGPLSLAQTGLEAGLLLADSFPHQAEEILREAELQNERLENFSGAELARLVRATLAGHPPDDEMGARLTQADLLLGAWWLVPRWLEHEPTPRLAQRCLALRPGLAAQLSPAARQRIELPGPSPALRIHSLGVQEIYLGGERLPDDAFKKNQKARVMLTYLAMARGRAYSDDVLAELFWPEEGARGRKNVYSLRSIWRRALQSDPNAPEYVVRLPQGLAMSSELEWWHDAEELRRLLQSWEALAPGEQLPVLRRVAELYRGPFLENCYMDWAVFLREQLDAQTVRALLALAQRLEDPGAAAEVCLRAVEIDPCAHEVYHAWMVALNRGARPQDALKVFERAQRVLRKELGMDPPIPLLEEQTRARLLL